MRNVFKPTFSKIHIWHTSSCEKHRGASSFDAETSNASLNFCIADIQLRIGTHQVNSINWDAEFGGCNGIWHFSTGGEARRRYSPQCALRPNARGFTAIILSHLELQSKKIVSALPRRRQRFLPKSALRPHPIPPNLLIKIQIV